LQRQTPRAKNLLADGLRGLDLYAGRRSKRRYGEDLILDVTRLANAWSEDIRTVFDVGANVGQTALHYRKVFPKASIWSFEPHSETFAELDRTASALADVKAFNVALGDTNGFVDFFQYEQSLINSRHADHAYPGLRGLAPRRTQVTQETLDGFCTREGVERIEFLKIDTEGSEASVLTGAKELLARRAIRFVLCEVSIASAGRVTSVADIVGLLAPFGYELFSIYIDYALANESFFVNGNALFVLPP
jgi:FkbM family methyltransferase